MVPFTTFLLLLILVGAQSGENATAHGSNAGPANSSLQVSASITSGTPSTTEKVQNGTPATSDHVLASSSTDNTSNPMSFGDDKKTRNRSATLNPPDYMRPGRANVLRRSPFFPVIASIVVAVISGTSLLVFAIFWTVSFLSAFKGRFKATSGRLLKRVTRRLTTRGDDTTDLLQSINRSASDPMLRAGCSGEGHKRIVPYSRSRSVAFGSTNQHTRIV
ncbi:uncharacterized protein LOC135399608 [Ornithodoros turicata]|uniref:uncharacterized protein LOC135399608 n=1 Tax=Ornithodoros turicata TaxID=34597 RepID=UPI0031396E41